MKRRRIALVAAVALTAAGFLFATALPASAAGSTAVFTRNTQANDYTALYTITNGGGSAWSGWSVEFDLPGGYVGAYWDALMVRTGDHYRFTNREYNGRVAAGGTTSFGFNAGGGVPSNCTLNGALCGGGPAEPTDPPVDPADALLSRGRPASASSQETAVLTAAKAVDGDASTRWSSQFSDPQWVQVDLGGSANVKRVKLNWETAYGAAYRIEVSNDGATFRQIYATTTGDGGVDDLTGLSGSGRYVRVTGTSRATGWGYSLWEFEVYGSAGGVNPPPPPPPPPPGPDRPFRVAPYVATFISNDLPRIARDSGHKHFILGFVNSTGACAPVWSTDNTALRANVASLRAAGGDVIVASGGWTADDLVRHCADGRAAADAYQQVLDAYASDHLDLDPENAPGANNLEPAIVDRRNDALKILQDRAGANGRTLHVSYTLGVNPDHGFNAENLYVLQSAVARGVQVEVVNPMTMNFYDGVSGSQMGERSIAALEKVHGQLKQLYPGRTDAQIWGMIGATPMIGQNDAPPEVFTLADARKLVAFANEKHLARLSFWSMSRDNGGCPGKQQADASCSGIAQSAYEFTRILQGFTG